jgi:hypothetical protein
MSNWYGTEWFRRTEHAYSTRSYINERIAGEQRGTWVDYDLPWTSGSSADDVLAKALSFLGERCPKK